MKSYFFFFFVDFFLAVFLVDFFAVFFLATFLTVFFFTVFFAAGLGAGITGVDMGAGVDIGAGVDMGAGVVGAGVIGVGVMVSSKKLDFIAVMIGADCWSDSFYIIFKFALITRQTKNQASLPSTCSNTFTEN